MSNTNFQTIAVKTAISLANHTITSDSIKDAWEECSGKENDGPALTSFKTLAQNGCIKNVQAGIYIRKNPNPKVNDANQQRTMALYAKIKSNNHQWPYENKNGREIDDIVIWNQISQELNISTVKQTKGAVAVMRGLLEAGLLT